MPTIDPKFNGLISSALPNIFVRRITLEQTNFSLPSSNKSASPYLDESTDENNSLEGWNNVPSNQPEFLKVKIDANIKIPSSVQGDIIDFISDDNFIKYLKVQNVLWGGKNGRKKYENMMSSQQGILNFLNISLINGWDVILKEGAYQVGGSNFTQVSYNLKELLAKQQVGAIGNWKVNLPDGSVIYEVPFTMEYITELHPNVSDLVYQTYVFLDKEQMLNDLETIAEVPEDLIANIIGKMTSEVIIKDGKTQDTGQIFTISANQETEERTEAFAEHAGQVWLGGVHKHQERYMAGNYHTDDIHPFLDAYLVDNNKIQDFRQVARFEDNYFDFTSFVNTLGGNFKDLSNYKGLSFDKLPVFSPLMSSRAGPHKTQHPTMEPEEHSYQSVKLLFGVDYGKLLKRYAALPSLLDKLVDTPDQLNSMLDFSTHPVKESEDVRIVISKQRIDVDKNVVNPLGDKKVVYEGNLHNLSKTDKYTIDNKPNNYSVAGFANVGNLKTSENFFIHATDFSQKNTEGGKYKYSLEFRIKDPTVQYIVDLYDLTMTTLGATERMTVCWIAFKGI